MKPDAPRPTVIRDPRRGDEAVIGVHAGRTYVARYRTSRGEADESVEALVRRAAFAHSDAAAFTLVYERAARAQAR